MKLLIGADLVPTNSNLDLFSSANISAIFGDGLCEVLSSADYRVFNLEVPLTNTATPIDKCGPALIAPTSTVAGYKAIGVDLLTLANNHIMDQDTQGLDSTIKTLNEAGIAYFGAGNTLKDAEKPYIIQLEDKKIGVYACAEHEFSIAGDHTPGANPFDPLESLDHIEELKKQCDFCIVLYHGGKEHYRYPSPNLQKVCRKMVEKGADLVVCQHSHCIGCEEKYKDGTIVYGQGNFLFDLSEIELWQTSLLVEISDDFNVSYIPVVKKGSGVRLADAAQAKEILDAFYSRSNEILQDGVIEERYSQFAEKMLENYLSAMSGFKRGFFFKVINKLMGHRLDKWRLNKYYRQKRMAIRNYIECEAHRELLLRGIQKTET